MQKDGNEGGKGKLLVSVIMGLLLIIAVIAYFAISGKQELMASKAERDALSLNFKSLSDTLDARNAEIDKLKIQNIQLDNAISNSQKTIADEKGQLAAMLHKENMTAKELEAANKTMLQYQASISGLQKQILDLTAQNQQLTTENQQLSSDLNTVKKDAAALDEQNKNLKGIVAQGSLLQLSDIEVCGVKKRVIGKEAVVHNLKAVESLRITFETGNNKNLPAGELALYIKITNPKGELIYSPSLGSGTAKLADGTSMQYTRKTDIDWHQKNKKVAAYWTQSFTDAGTYKAEIYQSGYVIGKGEVALK